MNKAKKRINQDALILGISLVFAIILVWSGFAEKIVWSLGGMKYFGLIIAGMCFTSVFTTAPAIVLLGALSLTTSIPALVLFGGIGAVLGDFIVFHFVKDRISKDFEHMVSLPHRRRLAHIFNSGVFKFFVPFIGALVIASPLPDEVGVAMLGLSKVEDKYFIIISFFANMFGILVIAWVARAAVGM
jgi:hypothetical protein